MKIAFAFCGDVGRPPKGPPEGTDCWNIVLTCLCLSKHELGMCGSSPAWYMLDQLALTLCCRQEHSDKFKPSDNFKPCNRRVTCGRCWQSLERQGSAGASLGSKPRHGRLGGVPRWT